MDISIFFAQFWGWLFVIAGLIFLSKSKLEEIFKRIQEDKAFVMLFGWPTLILGLVTVILHNVWTADWRVVITIFGWFYLVRGIIWTGFPKFAQKLMPSLRNKLALMQILLIIFILLGVWLIWVSY